ncbi:MAG TPA: adenylate/guanylate cyclase domain-containing protein [Thermoleophilaceae bacterium]|nr:adenylate/guanylate cyclase domain-containing protein [Thermoleophilaceae bacterium]
MSALACANCGTENPEGARFCMSCGSPLARTCPHCGAEAPPGARFCTSCGNSLDAPAAPQPAAPSPAPTAAPAADERRRVTVLFADLSGYTAVAERMDPEAVKALVDGALRRLGEEVERFGGTVDKYIGDNVMAIFGAPIAHEDDAERAVRAGLGMQEAMGEINDELPPGVDFQLRVGINTGEVLAGAVGASYTVVGDTVNVAARLQSAARPGSVTVGEQTMRATRQAVAYEALAPLALKGKSERVPAWEAARITEPLPVGRAEPAREAPLVGRDYELSTLESRFERVLAEGRPQLVTLIGEAGVGKSRLLREFERRLEAGDSGAYLSTGRCLPYGAGVVYWALAEILRAECGIVETDSSEEAWRKLCNFIDRVLGSEGAPGAEARERKAALIGRSLGMDVPPELAAVEGDDPERVREAFFSALRQGIEALARKHPLVLAFEDIHWADAGMLDAIEHLARWVRAPLMLLCLARDELLEIRPDFGGGRRNSTRLFLEPLAPADTGDLVSALLPEQERVEEEMISTVVERSGGNPLFVEEIVRRLAEDGGDRPAELPDTVQGVLAARLDALDPFERRLVQQAAVVGRTFWEGSLASVAQEEGRDLTSALVSLQDKDILAPSAEGRLAGERELAFKHVLIRDVAYGMLPKAVRSRKHFEVGSFIEQRAGDRADEVAPLLAEHYGRAASLGREGGVPPDELREMLERAVRFLEEAGDAASLLFSNAEAASHYRHASELAAEGDPAVLARVGEKLGGVALRLGRVDQAIEVWQECLDYHRGQEVLDRVADLHRKIGYALSQKGDRTAAIEHYQKGINLLKDGEPRIELVRLYEEAAWLYLHTGDNMLAIYASEKALRLAERLGEDRAASRAHGIFGRVFGRIGDNQKARENLERAVDLARGAEPGETILALAALGRHLETSEADVAGALAAYEEALEMAERTGNLPAQVELQSALAQLAAYRADWGRAATAAAASAELAEREGLEGKLGLPYALQALLLWRSGDLHEAIQLYRRAHELAERVGWSELAFQTLYGLALTQRDCGDLSGAKATLDAAVDVCERSGLIAQSIQATGTRAVVLALAGRREQASESAAETAKLAERIHYPLGRAAALEARGAAAADPEEGAALLLEAEAAWAELERPLEATRCRLLAGRALAGHDAQRSRELLEGAAAESERLGVAHLAEHARELAATA